MAKYKVGDKVRIVSERPWAFGFPNDMVKYLGKTLTVARVNARAHAESTYRFEEAVDNGYYWLFDESWISGLAEPEREPCTVELRFDGMITTATLKRGGRDVKTAEARCNPKDTYSRAEGARVAVERLFEKKRKEDKPKKSKPKKSKPKIWDKFVVTGNEGKYGHCFNIGEIVTLVKIFENGDFRLVDEAGFVQTLHPSEVRPYKEKSK